MIKSYDVVIVGAGPGGLICAQELVKARKKVLLLEKKSVIGPKVCAGGIRYTDFQYLGLPEELRGCDIDDFGYLTVDREKLGTLQLQKLSQAKITIRRKARVTKIEEGAVVVNHGERIRFTYLVGADGSLSTVRSHLKLKDKYVLHAIQYCIPAEKFNRAKDFKKITYYGDPTFFHAWYAWIFPHKNFFSIGCGCSRELLSPKKLEENFKKWLLTMEIATAQKKLEGFPINCDYRGYRFENIFLAGDAAGLAAYETGEGIHQALVSGEEIAKMIVDPTYQAKKLKDLLLQKKRAMTNFMEKITSIQRRITSKQLSRS